MFFRLPPLPREALVGAPTPRWPPMLDFERETFFFIDMIDPYGLVLILAMPVLAQVTLT